MSLLSRFLRGGDVAHAPARAAVSSPEGELRGVFASLDEWRAFERAHPWIHAPASIAAIARQAQSEGIVSTFLGRIDPSAVVVGGENYREQLMAGGFNPRQRAVMDLFAEAFPTASPRELRIYAHEAMTPFALLFRGRFARFLGSEYAADAAGRDRLFPIPVIDITRSDLPDAAFDAVISMDVLEHVPDLDAALYDTARILKPGGRLLATFPFRFGANETMVKSVLRDGEIRYLMEPEYHGNPVDPEGGSLVFQVPGWDVLDRARHAGFGEARFVFWSSRAHGLTGAEIAGIFVMEAWR